MPTTLNESLTFTLARRVILHTGQMRAVHLALIGCGGTGSFLALHLARLAWHAREKHHLAVEMMFVDPDRVAAKNIGRQNFVPAEIGAHKAEALATRYNLAFGLAIRFVNEPVTDHGLCRLFDRDTRNLNILVGCVDNAAARAKIRRHVDGQRGCTWWLDCGNHDLSGQVLLGNRDIPAPEINPLGFCTGLPLPSVQHPELLEAEVAPVVSCAEAASFDVQSLMVNQQVAGWAASYLYRLIIRRDLDIYATYFDLAAGSARSEGIR